MDIQTTLALAGFLLAVGSNLIWLLVTYANGEKKKYAAERDFNHIKNNQLQISEGIAIFTKDLDNRLDDIDKNLIEIKSYMVIHASNNTNRQQ
ncbi:hypothetical protein NIES4103_70260 (plasmid) [Nostoc sp. NIES-4103]|nr:hypothetical protein NIES4103_27380 [Nostoc sp. NIES-4103]BAZ54341.1 hypothetical protein NIES4103_70260 [Nostoc sp. NIES-4103]